MFKLNAKFDANSLLYSLSHFECDSLIVHMLTQQYLPPPLTSTAKSSLFIHAHSTPPPLAVRLHHDAYIVLVILTMAGLFLAPHVILDVDSKFIPGKTYYHILLCIMCTILPKFLRKK